LIGDGQRLIFNVKFYDQKEIVMALINVLKYEAPDDSAFVWKHPSDQIKIGSQLVVNEGQQAIFVKGGQALDCFDPGTHTLLTGNIPLIDKLINLPFGGDTPFSAEVWFVNTTVKRDLKWGTPNPIPLLDPSIGFPVSARAFGKWGARIIDGRSFVSQIVGSQSGASAEKVHDYFIGQVVQSLVKVLGGAVARGEASILQIAALVSDLSDLASSEISQEFQSFGVDLVNFNIESINIPDDEMKKIQEVFAKAMEARELSKVDVGGAFAQIKTFEVLNNAASNPSDGTVGAMLGAGIGLGAGLPLGGQMSQKLDISGSTQPQDATEQLRKLKQMLEEELITQEQYEIKQIKIVESM
jgi:membrane protease subunit (stomatin/prohibitin family)